MPAPERFEGFRQNLKRMSPIEEIKGIGSEAFRSEMVNSLYVRKDENILAFVLPEKGSIKESLIDEIAKLVSSRL